MWQIINEVKITLIHSNTEVVAPLFPQLPSNHYHACNMQILHHVAVEERKKDNADGRDEWCWRNGTGQMDTVTHTHACTHARTHRCTPTHAHTRTHAHARTHTHTHKMVELTYGSVMSMGFVLKITLFIWLSAEVCAASYMCTHSLRTLYAF